MTESNAKELICPVMSMNGLIFCKGKRCALWKWDRLYISESGITRPNGMSNDEGYCGYGSQA